ALAWEYRKSHPDSTLFYCREILSSIENEHQSSLYPEAMNYMGLAHHYKGDDAEAYAYYRKAYDAAVELPDSLQVAHSLNNLGRFYSLQGDFVKAYETYNQAIKIFEDRGDKNSMSYGYKSLAELYENQENYPKALQMAERTLELRKEVENVPGQVSVLIEMAEIYIAQNDFNAGIAHYEEAMLLASELRDRAMMANIYIGIAEAYAQQESYQSAMEETMKADRIAQNLQNQDLINRINLLKGKLSYQLNRFEASEAFLDDLMADVVNSGDLTIEKEAHYYMALLYKRSGRYEQAFEQFRMHHELMNTLENTQHARMIERLEGRLEIDRAEQENRILAAEKAAAQANEDRLRLQNVLLTVGILAAVIIMVILYLMNKKRKNTNLKLVQKNNFIAEQREEIRKQNEHIASQNEKLRQRNSRLNQLNNEKDTLMNILAHDLKAPFNRIKGLTHLMELSEIDDEQKKYVEMLNTATDSGLDLIRDLLEVSAFSGQKKEPEMKDLSLMKYLREKRESFRTDADSKHINLVVDLEEDIHLPGDPSYLSRILDNLISNAIKFSDPGRDVILSGGIDQGVPYVSVKDFGPGFSEADRKNLYHKFARLSAQPTAGESSNGLGLAIVKMLVESMSGEIELVSSPGQGSEFIIRFPAHLAQENPVHNNAS
ncbi:MAG: tetratricopeptide repeat-containing sensor histidine kinase, partial [Cyclobacteriaceae bacterium]